MTVPKCDVRLMVVHLAIIRGRVRKLIRVRELAALHDLEQMRSVRMLEESLTWVRENGFDRVEVIAEMHEEISRSLHSGFDPEPFYTGLYNPRWSPKKKGPTVYRATSGRLA